MPAVALLVGLVLGAVLVGVTRLGDSDDDPGEASGTQAPQTPDAAEPTRSPSPDPGVRVSGNVPQECLDAADEASEALNSVQNGLSAITNFDASQLRDVLLQLQDAQPRIESLAEQCRDQASATVGPSN